MVGVALLAVTAASLWFSSAIFTLLLRVRGTTATLLAWITLGYAQIILVSLAVSWPRALSEYTLAGFHATIALLAGAAWLRFGRPRLLPDVKQAVRRFRRFATSHWSIALLVGMVAVSAAVGTFLILYVPPNNWDSMTCHLARAAFWMQYERVGDYPSHNPLHNEYPMGASIAQMYALIFVRSDALPGFVQFGAWLGSFPCIYGIGRELRFRPAACVRAALIALLLPQFLLQSTSTQIDLLFALTVGLAVYYMLRALRTDRAGPLVLAGIAMGLMFGTKGSTPLFGPLFATCLVAWSLIRSRKPVRFVLRYGAVCLVFVALLGIESYASNLLRDGSSFNEQFSPKSSKNDPRQARTNLVRFTVGAFELPFGRAYWLTSDYRRIAVARELGQFLRADVDDTTDRRSVPMEHVYFRTIQEDVAWYGLGGFFLFPLACYVTMEGVRYRAPSRRRRWIVGALWATALVLAMTISFLLAVSIALVAAGLVIVWRRREDTIGATRWFLAANLVVVALLGMALFQGASWVGRFFLPAALLAAALLPILFDRRKTAARHLASVASVLVAIQALGVLLNNERKPLLPSLVVRRIWATGEGNVFDLSRERRRAIVRPSMADLGLAVEAARPPIRRLGYISSGPGSWDFIFFGSHFERELVLIRWDGDWQSEVRKQNLEYVLLIGVPHEPPPGFEVLYEHIPGHTALLTRTR